MSVIRMSEREFAEKIERAETKQPNTPKKPQNRPVKANEPTSRQTAHETPKKPVDGLTLAVIVATISTAFYAIAALIVMAKF